MNDAVHEAFGPDPFRPAELPMEEHHSRAEESVGKFGGRIRHCFRSAFDHLRRSWTLHPIDSEMSLFRAITADEEAATALILALKQRQYEGVAKLNPWDHTHKAAVSPFLDAVQNMLAETGFPTPKLSLSLGGRPKIRLILDIGTLVGDAEPLFGEPDHPFNYLLRAGDNPKAYRFEKQLQALADERGSQSVGELVKREANLRNRLLYADDEGIASVNFNDSLILRKRDRVYRLALITIGVLQTTERQLFVKQCLDAFRNALGHIVEDTFDYEIVSNPQGFRMMIGQQPDGSYEQQTSYQISTTIPIGGKWLKEMRVSVSPSDDAHSSESSE